MITMPKKRYVLNLQKRTLQEVVFVPKPRLSLLKDPSKVRALRAGALGRMVNHILNRKNKSND